MLDMPELLQGFMWINSVYESEGALANYKHYHILSMARCIVMI